MKKTKTKHFKDIVKILEELNTLFPSYNMGRHLSTALFEQGDIWGMSNKELLVSLVKYKTQLELDDVHMDTEIDEIIEDAMDLDNILRQDEEDFIDGQHY